MGASKPTGFGASADLIRSVGGRSGHSCCHAISVGGFGAQFSGRFGEPGARSEPPGGRFNRNVDHGRAQQNVALTGPEFSLPATPGGTGPNGLHQITGQGTSFSIGRLIGGLAPFAIGYLGSLPGIGIGLALGVTSGFFLLAALLVFTLPDRSGQPLEA